MLIYLLRKFYAISCVIRVKTSNITSSNDYYCTMAQQGIINIPHLSEGDKIKDWKKTYLAASSILDEKQQIALLPVYVGRTSGERDIAHICAKKTTINDALTELELLIDGTPSRMVLLNRFWDLKPVTKDFKGLTSFFFTLQSDAKLAEIPNDVMFLRFLNFVKGGDTFFNQKETELVSTMKMIRRMCIMDKNVIRQEE